jgi:hypothetical protein
VAILTTESGSITVSTPSGSIYVTEDVIEGTSSLPVLTGNVAVPVACADGLFRGRYPYGSCAVPTLTPPSGSYTAAQTVTLASTTGVARIYYTTDGSTPTFPISGTTALYAGPIAVTQNTNIQAIAKAEKFQASAVASASYVIAVGPALALQGPFTLANAIMGVLYQQQLSATGGTPPYTFGPNGAVSSFNSWGISAGGLLSGTPSTAETDSIPVKVTDSAGTVVPGAYQVTVTAPSVLSGYYKWWGAVASYLAWSAVAYKSTFTNADSPGVQNSADNDLTILAANPITTQPIPSYSMGLKWTTFEPGLATTNANSLAQYDISKVADVINAAQAKFPSTGCLIDGYFSLCTVNILASTIPNRQWDTAGIAPPWVVRANGTPSNMQVPTTLGSNASFVSGPAAPMYPGSQYYNLVFANYDGVSQYQILLPDMRNPVVVQALIQMLQWLKTATFTITVGPFAGTWTLDTCPCFKLFAENTEMSLLFNSGPYRPQTPSGLIPFTWQNYFKGYVNFINSAQSVALPSTPVAPCVSYAVTGVDGSASKPQDVAALFNPAIPFSDTTSGLQPFLPTIMYGDSDTYGRDFNPTTNRANAAKCGFTGRGLPGLNNIVDNNVLPPVTTTSVVGDRGAVAQIQPTDWGGSLTPGTTPYSQAAVANLMATFHFMQYAYAPLCSGDKINTGGTNQGAWIAYIAAGWNANYSANPLFGALPVNFLQAPINLAVTVNSTTSVTAAWGAQNGVTWNVYLDAVLVGNTASTSYQLTVTPGRHSVAVTMVTKATGTAVEGPQAILSMTTLGVLGYDGGVAINAAGRTVNLHANPLMPRGANFSGPEGLMWSGGTPNDLWGGTFCGAGGPPWETYKTWGPTIARIPLNSAIFFNLPMGILTGGSAANAGWSNTVVPADVQQVCKPQLIASILRARANGQLLEFDLHWSAPAFTLKGVTKFQGAWNQPMYLNSDTDLLFWCAGINQGPLDANGNKTTGFVAWLMQNFGPGGAYYNPQIGGPSGTGDMALAIFNEPYPDQVPCVFNTQYNGTGTALTFAQWMMQGGWCSSYRNQGDTGGFQGTGLPAAYWNQVGAGQNNITTVDPYGFNYWWHSPGSQSVVNGIRALGWTGMIGISSPGFSQRLSFLSQIWPTDTLNPPQLYAVMHPYQYTCAQGGFQTGVQYTITQLGNMNFTTIGASSNALGVIFTATGSGPNTPNGATSSLAVPKYPGGDFDVQGTANWDKYLQQAINGTSGIGHPVPVWWTEYGNAGGFGSGPASAVTNLYMQYMHTYADAQPKGSIAAISWNWNYVAQYGYSGQESWTETIQGAPITFYGSIAGTSLTVTAPAPSGGSLGPGLVFYGGSIQNLSIIAQLTGTTGGIGTYQISYTGSASANTGFIGAYWLPLQGQGQTEHDWWVGHAP